MVNEAFPILKTPDIERALGFYQGLLDAEIEYRFPDDGDPAYVGLAIGRSRLGVAADPEPRPGQTISAWHSGSTSGTAMGCSKD